MPSPRPGKGLTRSVVGRRQGENGLGQNLASPRREPWNTSVPGRPQMPRREHASSPKEGHRLNPWPVATSLQRLEYRRHDKQDHQI
jgi:hypothetical protein